MRRTAFALALGSLLIAVPSHAQSPAPRGDNGATVLHLTETAQRAMPRDRLRADLRVEVSDGDPRKVQAEINQKMATALERAKRVASVQVETGGYGLWHDRPKDGPARWRGQQSLTLIGTEFADVLALAGELQQSGLVFSGMAFDLRTETARAAEDELTNEALARLRARAERVATEVGLDVLHYRALRVGNASGERPMPRLRMEMSTAAAAPPVAEAGEQTVQVTVEAEIVLGTARGP